MVFMAGLLELGVLAVVSTDLVVSAILLRVEALGVQSAGGGGDAGKNRQGDECGYDGLHGFSPIFLIDLFDQWVASLGGPVFVACDPSYGGICRCEKVLSRMRDKQ
jgi:hypothetical protein